MLADVETRDETLLEPADEPDIDPSAPDLEDGNSPDPADILAKATGISPADAGRVIEQVREEAAQRQPEGSTDV
jgi:hypothetical protein